uniref:Uncharacterized protein n=1 Tax=viral metagenome TaxID=1070528 RepID=A0A6C0L7W6_9ZZZZ
MYALQLFVCNRDAGGDDGSLCKSCAKKSLTHVRHEPRLHGLLTEPIPDDSHIFGGAWYMRMVERFGPPPMEWVIAAEVNQKIAEGWVDGAWKYEGKAQSDDSGTEQGMQDMQDMELEKGKKLQKKRASTAMKASAPAPAPKQSVPTPLTTVAPVEIMYREAAKPIRTFETDSYTITKGVFRDIPVWILPNGKMYDMDPAGNPKTLLSERYAFKA